MNSHPFKFIGLLSLVVLLSLNFKVSAQWRQVGSKIVDTTGNAAFPTSGLYGLSVAISPDGNRIVGAIANSNKGGWVYSINGSNFQKLGDIVLSEPHKNLLVNFPDKLGISFGQTLSIAADNKTIVIGYPLADPFDRKGATSVITFNGSTFTQVGNKLQGTMPGGNLTTLAGQGRSVSISGDGKVLIVGAAGYAQGAPQLYAPNSGDIGAAWVYTFNGTTYEQLGKQLIGTGVEGDGFTTQGFSVAMSRDGKTAIVAGTSDSGTYVGAVWVYKYNPVTNRFEQFGSKIKGFNKIGPNSFGVAISISSDGNAFVVGGPKDNVNIGAAWVFTFNGTAYVGAGPKIVPKSTDYTVIPPTDVNFVNFGGAVSMSGDGRTVIIGAHGDNGRIGAAWVYTFSGTKFQQAGAVLRPSDAVGIPNFGNSVSISEDGKRAAIGGFYDNTGVGAAWIFELCKPPVINSMCLDSNKIIRINATSDFPMSYQWYKDAILLPAGVTTVPFYNLTSSIASSDGSVAYSAIVSIGTIPGCTSATAFPVSQFNLTGNNVQGDLSACVGGDTVKLFADNMQSILWSNGETVPNIGFLPTVAGTNTYSFTGINAQACSMKGIVTVTVNSSPIVSLDLSSINNICDSLKVVTITGGAPLGGVYSYNTIVGENLALNISKEGKYLIGYSLTAENNCKGSINDTLTVIHCAPPTACDLPNPPCTCPGRVCPLNFKVYTGFTPNGDGINETMVIDSLTSNNTLSIIDRFGNEVFYTTNYNNEWVGVNKDGKQLPNGIYYYYYVPNGDTKKKVSGSISIIH